MEWLYKLLGFKEEKIIASNDIGDITIRPTDDPIYINGDTIWYKEGKRELK